MSRLGDPDLPLGPVLARLGHEARDLAALTERAEAALHGVLDGLTFLPIGIGHDLQQIDLVRQGLEDISRLLAVAALAAPATATLPPASLRAATRLGDMATRLTGAVPISAPLRESVEDDLGLF